MTPCTPECVRPKPFTRMEHCADCHQSFTGTSVGDKHRVGDHGVRSGADRRRCLSAEEMVARGMHLNDRGVWAGSSWSNWRERRVEAAK